MARSGRWALAIVAMTIGAGSARADALDGNWCATDGRVMTIEGSRILTPGGTATAGDYSRHAFAYTVPTTDDNAGAEVRLVLVNEDTVRVVVGPPPEIWRRCDVTS